jgi:hypothetical protein
VRRRLGRVEERVGAPHVIDIVDAEASMLEQVGTLLVDLEGIVLIHEVEVEQVGHTTPL